MGGSILWFEPKDYILQSSAGADGNGTIANLEGRYGALLVQIVGITSATVNFEASQDGGTTWDAVRGISRETGLAATSATADGTFEFPVIGTKLFRSRISSYVSGTINVYGTAVPVAVPTLMTEPATP
jgi:hypothetical protein